MDPQHKSTKSPQVEQLVLLPSRPSVKPADLTYVMGLSSFRRAVRYSMSLADLEPKQVYEPLGKDKATWSRIENGDMGFPADMLPAFQAITQNDAPLMWLNHTGGYDIRQMVRVKSSLEVENEKLRAEIAELRSERSTIVKFVQETRK